MSKFLPSLSGFKLFFLKEKKKRDWTGKYKTSNGVGRRRNESGTYDCIPSHRRFYSLTPEHSSFLNFSAQSPRMSPAGAKMCPPPPPPPHFVVIGT